MISSLSLEFFPPKTPEGAEKLRAVRQKLYPLAPEYCSVTFGAGGSTQDGTLETVREVLAEGHAGVPHLSCIGQTKDSIRDRLARYREAGVKRIVALRGDLPSGYGLGGEFRYASDLISFIRAETVAYEDYVALRGEAKAREAGKLRAEGKSYVVKDGDVMNFLFS